MSDRPEPARRRVAVIRGSTISPWEMQGFVPLTADYDLRLIGARAPHAPDEAFALPVTWLEEASARVERFPISQIRWRMRSRLQAAGRQHELDHLDGALRGSQLLHTVDFHYAFSEQAADFAARHGVPLVVTRWENVPFMGWRFGGEPVRRRCERVARAADCVLATTRGAAESLTAEGTTVKRIEVVYPGIDVDRFQPGAPDAVLQKRLGIEGGRPVVLFIGRLTWEKGTLDLLLAFGAIRARHRDALLIIAGSGPDAALLADAAARRGLAEAVRFVSTVAYEEVPALHRLADVFVLPSIPTAGWEEQFGMVLVEAMASGSAVVTTRCGAIPEVVGDAATVIEPHAPGPLADAVCTLLSDSARRVDLGARARARAATAFDARVFARAVAQVYASL